MTDDLFADLGACAPIEKLSAGTFLMRRFAAAQAVELMAEIAALVRVSPWRTVYTPGGKAMSVGMTNCGSWGWISDKKGYRYSACDPLTARAWPVLPLLFLELAGSAAAEAGFPDFVPDACILNYYGPGAKMTLHQDKNERDFNQPIVSISLGVSATFLLGGTVPSDKVMRLPLAHGDVVVWGGADRLRFHGIMPLANDKHPVTGNCRINLTLRKAQ